MINRPQLWTEVYMLLVTSFGFLWTGLYATLHSFALSFEKAGSHKRLNNLIKKDLKCKWTGSENHGSTELLSSFRFFSVDESGDG